MKTVVASKLPQRLCEERGLYFYSSKNGLEVDGLMLASSNLPAREYLSPLCGVEEESAKDPANW